MKKKIRWSLVLGAIPFLTLVFALPFVNRIEPVILGFPFVLFWIVLWILLTPPILYAAYRLEMRRDKDKAGERP
jgi:hypothetical protein